MQKLTANLLLLLALLFAPVAMSACGDPSIKGTKIEHSDDGHGDEGDHSEDTDNHSEDGAAEDGDHREDDSGESEEDHNEE